MGANALQEHIDHANATNHDLWLGKLCWYVVTELRISHTEVVTLLTKNGLGADLPAVPRGYNVFKRVSTNAARGFKRVEVHGAPTQHRNYLVREVAGAGENEITRRIVAETVDKKAKDLKYNTDLADVVYNRLTGRITVNMLSDEYDRSVDAILRKIREDYKIWNDHLDSYAIREFIRKMVLGWGATCIRDGLYFLPEKRSKEIDRLDRFVNAIAGASFHSMPLIDDAKQRKMVKEAFQDETVGAIDEMMTEVEEILASGKGVTADKYATTITRYQELLEKTQTYREILSTELGETNTRLRLFQKQLITMSTKIES